MNSLLRRQLRRHGLDEGALSEPVRELLRAVGEAYDQADDDRSDDRSDHCCSLCSGGPRRVRASAVIPPSQRR